MYHLNWTLTEETAEGESETPVILGYIYEPRRHEDCGEIEIQKVWLASDVSVEVVLSDAQMLRALDFIEDNHEEGE